MSITVPVIRHQHIELGDHRVFYRMSEPAAGDAPVLLMLHGFPSGSHQFRRLMDVLGGTHRIIAPDYPGFGLTETADDFDYTFEGLTDVVEDFVDALALSRFVLYVFDFGGPVGFRLAERMPERVAGVVVQNANAYLEGLSTDAQQFIALTPDGEGHEEQVRSLLTLDGTRFQYEHGTVDPSLLPPEGWLLDHGHLERPGRKDVQVALAFDYKSNLDLYPSWQKCLAANQPPMLVLWGRHDPFFLPEGALAYQRDVPTAQVHLVDAGHFALEDRLGQMAPLIADFATAAWHIDPP